MKSAEGTVQLSEWAVVRLKAEARNGAWKTSGCTGRI